MPTPIQFKIVMTGSQSAGKTSLLKRAISNTFDEKYKMTVGVDYDILYKSVTNTSNKSTTKNTETEKDTLRVWELGGRETFRDIITPYYKGANAVIVVTDLSLWGNTQFSEIIKEKELFIKKIQEIRRFLPNNRLPIYIVGTKHDIAKDKNIHTTALTNLTACATEHGITSNQIFTTTSKDQISKSNETDQFKSPDTLFNIILTQVQTLYPAAGMERARLANDLNDEDNDASLGSRLAAMLIGAFMGAVMGIIIHNPVTCFLAAWRTPDWAEWNIPNLFRIFIFAPIVNPLIAVGYGFLSGGATGAEWGVTKLLKIPRDMSEPFKLRTIITGSVLSVFIGVAVAVAVIHLLPVALPILLGVAAATVLVAGVSYEGIDSVLTDNELQETLKNKSASKPLLAAERSSIELEAHKVLSSSTTSSPTNQNNNFMAVNAYEKAHNAVSWRSWFQVPPAASSDNQTNSNPQATHLSSQP